jgi:hypothetical protein
MRVALLLCASCGFVPHAAQSDSTSQSGSDGSIVRQDAMADGNDAFESLARRKAITFTNKVVGASTSFPVWLDITDTDLAARAHLDDIYFSDGTTKLDREIMQFDNGHLQAWVRVPSLQANSVIYVYYGDPGPVDAENPAGVFSASFVAVWHLENANANVVDATGTHAGTATFTTATTSVTGKLGKGLQWTDSSDQFTFSNPLTGTTPHTMSVWIDQTQVTHTSSIVNVGTGTQNHARWFYGQYTAANTCAIGFYSNDWVANTALGGAGMTYYVWTFEGANGINHLYKNGVEIAGSPLTLNNIDTQGTTGIVGHAPEGTYGNDNGLTGTIDELRIANVKRDQNWITTEFNNQSAPSSFYTLGPEEKP